jgi:hypothetical protein
MSAPSRQTTGSEHQPREGAEQDHVQVLRIEPSQTPRHTPRLCLCRATNPCTDTLTTAALPAEARRSLACARGPKIRSSPIRPSSIPAALAVSDWATPPAWPGCARRRALLAACASAARSAWAAAVRPASVPNRTALGSAASEPAYRTSRAARPAWVAAAGPASAPNKTMPVPAVSAANRTATAVPSWLLPWVPPSCAAPPS